VTHAEFPARIPGSCCSLFRMIRAAVLVWSLALASVSLVAQAPKPAEAPPGAAAGKEILQRKCFQCHQASMWSSLRQDRRAWESTLYRMVGRGALWTEDEIRAMADFLGQTRGPK
jgi:mono/diheme cytochrome c family protein